MAEPSLKLKRVFRIQDRVTETTDYISGRNRRSESCGKGHISNRDLQLGFELDLDRRMYTAFPTNQFGGPKWLRGIRREPLKKLGRTTHVHIETIDTGERNEWFGCEARHVITKRSETREGQTLSEAEFDGWYIEPPAAWLIFNPRPKAGIFHHIRAGTGPVDDYKLTLAGERETGFPVLMKRKSTSFHQAAGETKVFEHLHEEEVTELSEEPLGHSPFVPPPDFRRVVCLDGVHYRFAYRLRLRWEFFKASLTLSRKIANYVR